MTFDEKKVRYQKVLVDEYREGHPEETEGYSDEEVALMTPLTPMDVVLLLETEKFYVQRRIDEGTAEIEGDLGRLDDPKTFHEALAEIRNDIRHERKELEDLMAKIKGIETMIESLDVGYECHR